MHTASIRRSLLATSLLATGLLLAAAPAFAQITFYEREGFAGSKLTAQRQVDNLERSAMRHRATSIIVERDLWEVCDGNRFDGRCKVLRPGRYPSLAAMGMSDRVSSVRMLPAGYHVGDDRYAPAPWVVSDYGRRHHERVENRPEIAEHRG